jgi:hypothetical protein
MIYDIHFIEVEQHPETTVWSCRDSSGSTNQLGTVAWFGPRRQYCFFPEPITVFSADCMRDIVSFVEQKNKEHGQ